MRAAIAVLAALAATGAALVAVAAASGPRRHAPSALWSHAVLASGAAALAYPAGWAAVSGDRGTVGFALRGRGGRYLGYLNLTPRQGEERLAGWAAFRTSHNAEDGDADVRELSANEHVAFDGARGSCVVDQYTTRVGSNRYRELACIVASRHNTVVFVGAALVSDWTSLGPLVREAAARLVVR